MLVLAKEKSRKHLWLEAAALYGQALEGVAQSPNRVETGQIAELLARCFFGAAFQSSNRSEFVGRMQRAKDLFRQAGGLYESAGSEALEKRSQSRSLFADFWLEEDHGNRRKIVGRCISLASEAVGLFGGLGEKKSLAETRKEILGYSREALELATDREKEYEEFQRTVETGRIVVDDLVAIGDDEGLIEALHSVLWVLAVMAELILDPPLFKQFAQETIRLRRTLSDASERVATPYALCLANESAGDIAWDLEGDLTKALNLYQTALASARKANDSLATGRLCAVLAGLLHWRAIVQDFTGQRQEVIEQGLKLATEAIEHLKISYHTSYLAWAHSIYAECCLDLANLVEMDSQRKRAQFSRAMEIARRGLTYEKSTKEWQSSAHALSKAMYFLATGTTNHSEKAQLLKEALPIREETVRVTDAIQPHSWNRGVMRNYLALTKAELAGIEPDETVKRRLLREAVSHMEECLELCGRWAATVPGSDELLAQYTEWYGDVLRMLHDANLETETAKRAIKAYADAIHYLSKAGQVGPIPTIRWKIAKLYDRLGDFNQAADSFATAVEAYRLGAKKIPGLASIFGELAFYMEAWASIETARYHHAEEECAEASELYSTAARLLRTTRTWTYLAPVFAARSFLEGGEALSSEERHTEAIHAFRAGITRFREATNNLENRLRVSNEAVEQGELKDWLDIAHQRESYCTGRLSMEEARAFDKKGDKNASARKYRDSSKIFTSLLVQVSNVQDQVELEALAKFCDGWARMKQAEAKASPETYLKAAESFLSLGSTQIREKVVHLALANAAVCRALASGTLFRQTRDVQLYSEIKKQLEAAADYYRQAGFRKTEAWTRATQRLFDALVFISDAEIERGASRKTELYHMAEKHLELAAKLYGEAGFPTKKKEALSHLERVREEKQVLLAALEALSQIPTATSIALAPQGRGQPVGIEKFEEAYVVGDMNIPQRELPVGSDFIIELEAANVGRTPATLVKLLDIVPEGLELDSEKTHHRIEDSFIDLEGKRLEHLKTHQVKVILKTSRKGVFKLRPRLFFVDDRGNYKSYRFQASTITVMELEISVPTPLSVEMAPPKIGLPVEFRFETERAREVFQCLVKEFLSDYMSKRIYVEKAGWRSLMDLVRQMKIPRSALYGPRGRDGPTLSELERRGLVESRIFPKERGRGGAIKKVRVAYDNAIVKKVVEQTVVENR